MSGLFFFDLRNFTPTVITDKETGRFFVVEANGFLDDVVEIHERVRGFNFNPSNNIVHFFKPNFKTVNHVNRKNSYQVLLLDEKNVT
jgi:hypothetical protein